MFNESNFERRDISCGRLQRKEAEERGWKNLQYGEGNTLKPNKCKRTQRGERTDSTFSQGLEGKEDEGHTR